MSENFDTKLTAFRKQIDELDDKIIHLLMERIGVVSQVGAMKQKDAPGVCPIRAGREAEQLRRIIKQFENTGPDKVLPPAAAASLWRIIIGMSTSIESPLKLSAYTPVGDNDLFWLAREYFGSFLPVIRQPQIKRVIGDVMDGKASVGIVPIPRGTDSANWWINLMEESEDIPKVFARIPFVSVGTGRDAPSGLAIARVKPEASGDDMSLWVLEADHNVSQNRLQTAFATAKLEVQWINVSTLNQVTRHHLVEIKGFITPDHDSMKSLLAGLGKAIVNTGFLGAYAAPITLGASETKPTPHAAATPAT
jgi:chorismate mutase